VNPPMLILYINASD